MNRRRRRSSQQSIPVFVFPAAIVAIGMAALVLSMALPKASTSAAAANAPAMLGEPSPDMASYDQPVVSTAKRLAPSESAPTADAAPQAAPIVQPRKPVTKAVAPSAAEAMPVSNAKSLGGPAGHAASLPDSIARSSGPNAVGPNAAGVAATTGPYTVVIVPEGPPEVDSVAQDLQASLKTHGIDARVSSLDDAGRPDAVVVLGQAASASTATWVCDPGPEASAVLAKDLDGTAGPSGISAAGPQTSFPCADVHAGRARVPAVLMELPPTVLDKRDSFAPAADGVATGISRYFTENAATVRSARAAARLIWPAKGPITSYYGPSHPLGIDIGQMSGNIIAATDGTVVFAGGDPCCSYGRYVVIVSNEGIQTLYAHLSNIGVRKGQKVRQGQVLGIEGCTGHCTGPHLHFEVYDQGQRENPLLYLP